MRISDWSSDVCSSDLLRGDVVLLVGIAREIEELIPHQLPLPHDHRSGARAQHGGISGKAVPIFGRRPIILADEQSAAAHGPLFREQRGSHVLAVERPRWRRAGNVRQRRQQIEVRSEEHTTELQSLMRSAYAVYC